ncbi:MAG: hypothetical protein HRT58_13925 [Crocinitomicaceae bacterium]|nr:hypothetical protein [Flavobacteriales bacterium]NQZ36764.1 hypothetical protein [Crocinitomicaceae bacterium]
MKSLTTLAFVFIYALNTVQAQDPLSKIQDKLLSDPSTAPLFRLVSDKPSDFFQTFMDLRKEHFHARKMTGGLFFGFNGNSTSKQELFKLNTGVNFKRGNYPYQITFKSQLNIQIQNGKLQENLSNLHIAYNRFVNYSKEPLLFEWYVFMNRSSNQFMGVNQRYETGAGYVLTFWKREKNLSKASKAIKAKLTSSITKTKNGLKFCSKDLCVGMSKLDKSDIRTILNAKKSVIQNLRIKETKYRFSLLAGLFYEAENMTFSDSLLTLTGKQKFTHEFDATNNFRFTLGVKTNFNLSYLTLNINPRFKLPLSSSWMVERDGRSVYDMRFELPIELTAKVSKKFSMGIQYSLFHDQAPSSFQTNEFTTDSQVIYNTTSRNNHVTSLAVKYTF